MKTIVTTLILSFFITINSSAQTQDIQGGGGFTLDGLEYEIINFDPDEVTLVSGTFTNPFIIPSNVTFEDINYRVVKIGFGAFSDTIGLTSMTLPDSLREISTNAFFNTGLTEVTALGTTPAFIEGNSFGDRSVIDLVVPPGSEEIYLNNGWSGFASINGITGTVFEVDNIRYGISSLSNNTVDLIGSTSILAGNLNISATVTFNGTVFTVTTISDDAFKDNQLISVTMPNTIVSIGEEAFRNNQLTSVTLPNTLTTIGELAFMGNQLTSVTLPNTITTIDNRAFQDNQLTSATIPTSLTVLESSVFRNNELLSISIPDGIINISPFVFDNNNLTTITIPASVTSIESFAFFNNPLVEMDVLATVPPVISSSEFAFGNLGNIDLTVPEGTEAGYIAAGWVGFNSINGIQQLEVGVTFDINGLDYTITALAPNEVNATGGTAIPTNLVIPESVTIQDVEFSVVGIGNTAFQGESLTNVTLPASVTTIGFRAFRLNQIGSIVIPNSVTSLGNGAFEVNALTSVTISENLTSIGNQVFRNNQLTSVTIPANINSLGNNCFRSNPLTEVIVVNATPPNINSGSGDSFQGIRGNIALTVPVNTELDYLLNGWTGFMSINGEDAGFFNEFEVNNITYKINRLNPNEVETANTSLTGEITIPSTVNDGTQDYAVISIGNSSFRNKQLTAVSLPNSITSIQREAFRDNQLTSISIPASVNSMGIRVFRDNPLTTVIAEGTVPSSISDSGGSNDSFGLSRDNIDLFIPTGTNQDYIDATWTGFKSTTEANKALVLKVFLQGASLNPNTGEETLMRDDLRAAGHIPTISPYTDAVTANAIVFDVTGNDAIVDWVFVELRDANNNTSIIESGSALLQRDGDVVATDGVSPFTFVSTLDDYFVAVKHRNHLGIMVESAKRLSPVATVLNFTKADISITNGTNAQTDIGMPTGTVGMWSGNVNGDTIIKFSGSNAEPTDIKSAILDNPGNFFNSIFFNAQGYFNEDVNMNGAIKFSGENSESLFIKSNILNNPGNFFNSIFFTITTQIP